MGLKQSKHRTGTAENKSIIVFKGYVCNNMIMPTSDIRKILGNTLKLKLIELLAPEDL